MQTEITSNNKLVSDLVDDTNNTHKFVSAGEKETWNAKYNKPSGGIPKTDLTNEVQTSLRKADTALQQHQDTSGKEDKSNKVTSIDDTSTDIQYPSAKSVYDSQQNQDSKILKLQQENQHLKETLVTTTGTGENITLNKTAELDFVVPPLPEGNTKQNTTEGYQLIELADFTSFTNNGITFTKLDDGGIKVNGTSTSQAYINLLTGDTSVSNNPRNITLEADEYYTLSGSSSNLEIMIHTSGYAKVHSAKGSNVTFKETTETNISTVRINVNSGTTINNEIIYPMLEKGSTAHDFEKYTGGQASPNPEYEQEVQVVKGDVEVLIQNKNIAKIEDFKEYYTLDGDGLPVYTTGLIRVTNTTPINVKSFDNVIVSFKSNTSNTINFIYSLLDANNNLIRRAAGNSSGLSINTSTAEYLYICFYDNVTLQSITEVQVEPNTTQAPYTPHKEQKLPLTLGNIELCKIEDYKDKFEKDNGVWKIPNKILKIDSYNGETITTPYISSTGGLDIGATVYYVGDNALEITDTTLISQLEAINNAISYEGQTNISGTSSGINPLFDVEAYQSTKLLLENALNRLELLES